MANNITISDKNTGDSHTAAEYNAVKTWLNEPSQSLGTYSGGAITIDGTGRYSRYVMSGNLVISFASSGHKENNVVLLPITSDGSTLTFSVGDYDIYLDDSLTNGGALASGEYLFAFMFIDGAIEIGYKTSTKIAADVTAPTITSATFAADNSYIDVLFSEGIYGANDGSTPAALSDFSVVFAANGGTATGWTASSVKQNDNTTEGSTSALVGGETTIRIFGSTTGTADGNETVTISPTGANVLFDIAGNAMDDGQSAIATLGIVNNLLTSLISYYGLGTSPRVDAHGVNDLVNVGNVTIDAVNWVLGTASTKISLGGYLLGVVDGGLAFGDEDFTISGWIRLDTKTDLGTIMSKWDATNNDRSYALAYEPSSNSFRFYVSSNGTDNTFVQDTSVADPAIETWYHIVAWHDSVNNQIGISVNNATPVTSSYSSGVNQNIDDEFVLGLFGYINETSSKGSSLDGNLDEVGIWGRVLTSGERALLYNNGNGYSYNNFQ